MTQSRENVLVTYVRKNYSQTKIAVYYSKQGLKCKKYTLLYYYLLIIHILTWYKNSVAILVKRC